VKLAGIQWTDVVVDVACGTGDLTSQFCRALWKAPRPAVMSDDEFQSLRHRRAVQVIGVDFTYEMLPIARRKGPGNEWAAATPDGRVWTGTDYPIRWINGDAQALPLAGASADVVSIAFGIRNVADPAAAIREFYRVLRPGGRLIILEFSLPTNRALRGLYNFYFRKVLPRTATLISGDKTGAYKYLPESVNTFIGREQMAGMMRDAGFGQVEQFPLTFGVCVCYRGIKA
jgi:demethylmenaquinone methyltransferase/2-methoxy-6-polyprenyl-1,4-benzoquinol methylase